MATNASEVNHPTLFDWAAARQTAKAAAEKDFTEKANRLSRVSTELHEAQASNAPRWRLEKLRKQFSELEQDCNIAKKASRQLS